MKKAIFLVVLLCSCLAAVAQEVPESERPSRDEIVRFFDTMHIREQMDSIYGSIGQQLDSMISAQVQQSGQKMTPQEREKMQELMQWTLQRTRELYPMSEMLNDMIPVYQKYMSKADLQAIMAFYSSPAGQHMMQRMPMMTNEAMQTVMPKMQSRLGGLNAEMQAKLREMFPPEKQPAATPAKAKPAAPASKKTTPTTKK